LSNVEFALDNKARYIGASGSNAGTGTRSPG
jgi:hypothetical protein